MGSVEMVMSQIKLSTETLIEPTLSAYSVSSHFIVFHIIRDSLFLNTTRTCSYHLLCAQRFTRHSNRSREYTVYTFNK